MIVFDRVPTSPQPAIKHNPMSIVKQFITECALTALNEVDARTWLHHVQLDTYRGLNRSRRPDGVRQQQLMLNNS